MAKAVHKDSPKRRKRFSATESHFGT